MASHDEWIEPPLHPAGTAEGEIRQLTVMFCDLVGYTRLAQRFSNPRTLYRLTDLKNKYVESCTAVIEKYRGEVKQIKGDGVVAYFGLPAAGNYAERGVRAALEIVQAIKNLDLDEPLEVRIGVATGPVIVGASASSSS